MKPFNACACLFLWVLAPFALPAGCAGEAPGPNRRPLAEAGTDQVVWAGESVELDGSASFDPDGDAISFQWVVVAAPEGSQTDLQKPDGGTLVLVANVPGIWLVRLTVDDGELLSEPDVVQVRSLGQTCLNDQACDDGKVCTTDRCDPTRGCIHIPNTVVCDDGDPCSTFDRCDAGVCKAGLTNKDNDRDGFLAAACPGGNDCDDENPSANPGMTEEIETALTCSDGLDNDCDGATDGMDPGCLANCTSDPQCDDRNRCNGAESCVQGQCKHGSPLGCDDHNPCTNDSCDPNLGCQRTLLPDGAPCGPRTCVGLEWREATCASGTCNGRSVIQDCQDESNSCAEGTCSPSRGCGSAPLPDSTKCGSPFCSDLEWLSHTCQAGACSGSTLLGDCVDGDSCTEDLCNGASGCANKPFSCGLNAHCNVAASAGCVCDAGYDDCDKPKDGDCECYGFCNPGGNCKSS